LPPGFMQRQKKGFSVPLAQWIRNDFGPILRERLVAQKTLAPWFRQDVVERMVDEHISGRGAHSNRLWSLLVLSQWVTSFEVPL